MRLVIIESPYKGQVLRNMQYLKKCMIDSISRGESPFASHAMYTGFLNDDEQRERQVGMACGFAWLTRAHLVAVYTDHGISEGMTRGIEKAQSLGIPVEFRRVQTVVAEHACKAYEKANSVNPWIPKKFSNNA